MRRACGPTDGQPSEREDVVDDPNGQESRRSGHRPSVDSRRPTHIHPAAVVRGARRPVAVVRHVDQPFVVVAVHHVVVAVHPDDPSCGAMAAVRRGPAQMRRMKDWPRSEARLRPENTFSFSLLQLQNGHYEFQSA